MDQLLWYLLAGSRGGPNRLKILELIHDRPYNAHQLSELTQLDYRTVCHHLDVLTRHHVLVNPNRDAYGALYFLSGLTQAAWPTVALIKSRISVGPARTSEPTSKEPGLRPGNDRG
jgi:DNA-binding transcriptional ArsR family regulator